MNTVHSLMVCCNELGLPHRGTTLGLLLLQCFSVGLAVEYSSCFISLLNLDLYVCYKPVLMH